MQKTNNRGGRRTGVTKLAMERAVTSVKSLLAECAEATETVEQRVRSWAVASHNAIAQGLMSLEAVQELVCAQYPSFTAAKGKLSKTPNSSFRSHWSRFVLFHTILVGTNEKYRDKADKATANAFLANDWSLSRLADTIVSEAKQRKADAAPKLSKTEREAAKAAEQRSESERLGKAAAMNPAAIRAFTAQLQALTPEQLAGMAQPIGELLVAVRDVAKAAVAAQRSAAAAAKKAA